MNASAIVPGRRRCGRRAIAPTTVVALGCALLHAASGWACLYTVQPGDTADKLSNTLSKDGTGCALEAIDRVNIRLDISDLEPGRQILLPMSCECPAPATCSLTMTLGDTANSVAAARGCRIEDLQAANPALDLEQVASGTQLAVPTDVCRCWDVVVGCGYVASEEDTLADLAVSSGCVPEVVVAYNPGVDPDDLLAGQKLVIPPNCECPAGGVVSSTTDVEMPVEPPAPVVKKTPALVVEDTRSEKRRSGAHWGVVIAAVALAFALVVAAVIIVGCVRRMRVGQAASTRHMESGNGGNPGHAPSSKPRGIAAVRAVAPSKRAFTWSGLSRTRGNGDRDPDSPDCSLALQVHRSAVPATAPLAGRDLPVHVEMSWITNDSRCSANAAGVGQRGGGQFVTMSTVSMPTVPLAQAAGGAAASGNHAVQQLEDMLDRLHVTGSPVLSRWVVLSTNDRRIGGQGVVQFVWDAQTKQSHAIKFFLKDSTFWREVQLYARPKVREMMAAVVHMQEAGLVTPNGDRLPAFIVLKKGSTLDDWAHKRQPDFATSLQVLMQIVERLASLHAAGYVHRDLKPANILWRTEDNSWTLIDFGCVAELREGSTAGLAATLAYAPPEIAAATESGQKIVEIDPAADMWSLGIVVYELLTKQRVFPAGSPRSAIISRLLGRSPLPWEVGAPYEERRKVKKLGLLKRAVLSCLSRTPSHRPTAEVLLLKLNSMLEESRSRSGPPKKERDM